MTCVFMCVCVCVRVCVRVCVFPCHPSAAERRGQVSGPSPLLHMYPGQHRPPGPLRPFGKDITTRPFPPPTVTSDPTLFNPPTHLPSPFPHPTLMSVCAPRIVGLFMCLLSLVVVEVDDEVNDDDNTIPVPVCDGLPRQTEPPPLLQQQLQQGFSCF